MATGNVADGESHGHYGESESQSDAEKTDAQLRVSGGQHGAAATAEDQPERSDEFSRSAFG